MNDFRFDYFFLFNIKKLNINTRLYFNININNSYYNHK